jgi:hypothetical protein
VSLNEAATQGGEFRIISFSEVLAVTDVADLEVARLLGCICNIVEDLHTSYEQAEATLGFLDSAVRAVKVADRVLAGKMAKVATRLAAGSFNEHDAAEHLLFQCMGEDSRRHAVAALDRVSDLRELLSDRRREAGNDD